MANITALVGKSVERRMPITPFLRLSPGDYLIDIYIEYIYKKEKSVKRNSFQARNGGGLLARWCAHVPEFNPLYALVNFLNEINGVKAYLRFRLSSALRLSPGAAVTPKIRIEPNPFRFGRWSRRRPAVASAPTARTSRRSR